MGYTPPDSWTEVSGPLRKSGTVKLDANGKGVIMFTPSNANQRWVISTVITTTDQSATASLIPYVTGAVNSYDIAAMSPANQFGTSWDGNNDSFSGDIDVSPGDTFCVLYYPPPGQSGSSLSGVHATAVIQGTYYTRRS
jgi:hypothetical protein